MEIVKKEIHVTLGQLAQAESILTRMHGLVWPPRTAHTVRKLSTLVATELKAWHDQRNDWVRELGEEREPGTFHVLPQNLTEFMLRLNDLAGVEVVIAWRPFSFRELESAEDASNGARHPAKFSPADLAALGPLLGEPDDDD